MTDKKIESIFEDEDKELENEDEEFEDKGYGPNNPWDAPGMCLRDFIDFGVIF